MTIPSGVTSIKQILIAISGSMNIYDRDGNDNYSGFTFTW